MYNTIWYNNLAKPFFNPPDWVFSPVWVVLYGILLTALIIYSIVITKEKKFFGYVIFTVHMIFNLLWSPVFFILHRIDIALAIAIIMDFTAFFLIKKFLSVSKIAGLMLVPYVFWILFATYLNWQLLILN